jgi:hypothetical protein
MLFSIFLLRCFVLGRHKTVEGSADSNTHTFYCAPEKWKEYKAVAEALGVSASELLRTDINDTITKHNGGEFKPKFDLDVKEKELRTYKGKVEVYQDSLKKEILPNKRSAFDVMLFEAQKLGTDNSLVKNIDAVLVKLRNYDCTGKEQFNRSHVITFVLFVEAVLNKNRVEGEIQQYWRQSNKPEVKQEPKQEAPLAPITA